MHPSLPHVLTFVDASATVNASTHIDASAKGSPMLTTQLAAEQPPRVTDLIRTAVRVGAAVRGGTAACCA